MVRRKTSIKCIVTERDREIFRLLFEYKVATVAKIKEYCFGKTGIKRVYRRLTQLAGADFIGSSWKNTGEGERKIFFLTDKGKKELNAFYPDNTKNYKLKSEHWEHDLVLLDIGKRLSGKKNTVRYLSENILQSGEGHREDDILGDFVRANSDAYLDLLFKGERYNIAIEFENSVKSSKRYRDLVEKYYLAQGIDAVFYFHRDERVRKIIEGHEASERPKNHPKFFFCKVDNGWDWSKRIRLSNRMGQTVGI